MKILAPFTIDHPPTLFMLGCLDDVTRWQLTAPDDYLRYITYQWEVGDGFVNVEHDVEFEPRQVQALIECPHAWCWYPYVDVSEPQMPNLGLTKFSATFISMTRGMWNEFSDASEVRRLRWQRQPTWNMLDWWINRYMASRFPPAHAHYPKVVNRRPEGVVQMQDNSMAGFLHG